MNVTTTPAPEIATMESFIAALGEVTAAQLDAAKAAMRNISADSSLSAFLRTGQKQFASTAAYAAVFKGILAVFADGQKTPLLGFAVASKKDSPVLALLVSLGVLDASGKVIIGVMDGGKAWAMGNADKQAAFVALCHAATTTAAAAAKAKREANKPAPTPKEDDAPPTIEAELSPGQQDDVDIARIIARMVSGELSSENTEALLAVLAPHGVKAAPRVKAAAA